MAWNLRVSAALHQGDRKYMEDQYAIHYECDKETGKFLYAYFGIFDGHGGGDAAKYTKFHLHKNIIDDTRFWSDNSNDVLKAIEAGFMRTHKEMWAEIHKWPKTATGLPSTAGTTASVAFIKGNKLYTGHVGDSGIALGTQPEGIGKGPFEYEHLTVDHKPDCPTEKRRIEHMGGSVVCKAGVPRVVWNRPRDKGPVQRSYHMDKIPFLAVARALGDLWSYDFENEAYAVDPSPDVAVRDIDPNIHKCLVLASDGLWNLLDSKGAVATVEMTERKWFRQAFYMKGYPRTGRPYYHHASTLVNTVLRRWRARNLRADNTSAIVVMIDPPGQNLHANVEYFHEQAYKQRTETDTPFCARSFLKENEAELSDTEKYIFGMAGIQYIQYYDDHDRFELHFGQPTVRCNVTRGGDKAAADASISLYDVIIHKVATPIKCIQTTKTAPTNCLPRKSLSAKAVKKFRPGRDVNSWLSSEVADDDYDAYDPHGEKLPNWLDGDTFDNKMPLGTKPEVLASLNASEQSSGSSPADIGSTSTESDTSNETKNDTPATESTIQTRSRRTRSCATKLSAPTIEHKDKDPCAVIGSLVEKAGRSVKRLTRKSNAVVVVSPLKVKRQLNGATGVDLISKKRRLSMPPPVVLTKLSKQLSSTSPSTRTRSKVSY